MSLLDSINRKLTVLGDLDGVSELLKNLDGDTLVDDVVLGQQDVVGDVAGSHFWLRCVCLETLCKCLGEVVERGRRSDMPGDEVLKAPSH